MNIAHLKYALAVAEYGSINRAAEALAMNQPNLSRAVRDMEKELGTKLFARSARGMLPTADGELFLQKAAALMKKADEIDNMFKNPSPQKQSFSLAAPDCCYVCDAFVRLCAEYPDAKLSFSVLTASDTIRAVSESDCRIGIIRFDSRHSSYYKQLLDDNELDGEITAQSEYKPLISRESPAAGEKRPSPDMLEISTSGSCAVTPPSRDDAYRLLSIRHDMYMLSDPISEELMSRYGLIRAENSPGKSFTDMLIHKKNYRLSEIDGNFITFLCDLRRKIF